MPQVPITSEQLQQLQERVAKLSTDKAAADEATAQSSAAHVALQFATAEVMSADARELELDAVVTGDVTDLQQFIGTLITPPG